MNSQPATVPVVAAEPRPRLTVREMQIALEAARSVAFDDPASPTRSGSGDRDVATGLDAAVDAAGRATEVGGRTDRGENGAAAAALDESPRRSVTVDAAEPALGEWVAMTDAAQSGGDAGPWLPDHDGPVSLTGVTTPRTRSVRREQAIVEKPSRRAAGPARVRAGDAGRAERVARAALAAATAPARVAVIGACGGSGATTLAVLLAAAGRPRGGAVVLAGRHDRGALSTRAGSDAGDLAAVTAWANEHNPGAIDANTPGVGPATIGDAWLFVAGPAAHSPPGAGPGLSRAVLAAAGRTPQLAVLDCPDDGWELATEWATHVVVVAPRTITGLLAGEQSVAALGEQLDEQARLCVAIVDVLGRAPRRAGRAAATRLSALRLPTVAIPYDQALTDHPQVSWSGLRPRNRTAVCAALTQLIAGRESR